MAVFESCFLTLHYFTYYNLINIPWSNYNNLCRVSISEIIVNASNLRFRQFIIVLVCASDRFLPKSHVYHKEILVLIREGLWYPANQEAVCKQSLCS